MNLRRVILSIATFVLTLQPIRLLATDSIPTPEVRLVERSRPTSIKLTPRRGESFDLTLYYSDYGRPVDFTHAYSVLFTYSPAGSTNSYAISGEFLDRTNGCITIPWRAFNELVANNYTWDVIVSSASNSMNRAWGSIAFSDNIGYRAVSNSLQRIYLLDFAEVQLLNVGYAPFLSSYEIDDLRSTVTSFTTGTGNIDVQNAQVRGTLSGPDMDRINAAISELVSDTVTNIINGGTASSPSITRNGRSITITFPTPGSGGSGGGIGSYTNTSINNVANTNNVRIVDGINTAWSQDSNGVWRLDVGVLSNITGLGSVQIVVDGQVLWDISTNRTMTYVPFQMYTDDYVGNMQLYAGSRLAPSITFYGHPTGWGLYERGYNGSYAAGWSGAGIEIGLLHAAGIKLMSTNSAFEGRLVGDISGATGYPEPMWSSWITNRQLASLTITNSGSIIGKDAGGTTRYAMDGSSGAVTIRSQDSDIRYALAPTNMTSFAMTNVFPSGVTNVYMFTAQGVCTNHP